MNPEQRETGPGVSPEREEPRRSREDYERGARERREGIPPRGERRRFITGDQLRGRTVLAAGGQAIGVAQSLKIDSSTWRADTIEVKLNRDMKRSLGVRGGFFQGSVIELPTRIIQSCGDAIILSDSVEALRRGLSGDAASSVH